MIKYPSFGQRKVPTPYLGSGIAVGAAQPEHQWYAEGVHLKEIFGVIRRHFWIVLVVTLVIVVPFSWYTFTQPPTYQASALIRLEDARRAITGGIENETRERPIGRYTDQVLSQVQVLEGRTVLGEVVDREGLRLVSATAEFSTHLLSDIEIAPDAAVDSIQLRFREGGVLLRTRTDEVHVEYGMAIDLGGVRFTLPSSSPVTDSAILTVLPTEVAVDYLVAGLRAIPRKETDAIDVTFTSTDPQQAQRVVNAVVEVFQAHDARMAQQQSRRRRIFLEEQLRKTDSLLASAQHELSTFRSRERVYRSRDRSSTQQQALMSLDIRREELAASRRMYQSLLNTIVQSGAGERESALRTLVSPPEIASNPVIGQLYAQLVRYEADRDQLRAGPLGSTTENPDVKRLNSLVSATEIKLIEAARSHVASLEARIAALDDLRARNGAEAQQMPALEAEEERLMQYVASIGQVADQVRAELQQARMAEAVEAGKVEIVQLAPMAVPTPTDRGMKLMLALVLGLFFGVGGAFAAEALNTSIRRPQELSPILQVPELAIVPRMETPNSRRLLRVRNKSSRGSSHDGTINGIRILPETTLTGIEAYRTLRTNLILSSRFENVKTLVVTSASPGEGKTTTAANLAVSFAHQGFRVLLVDTDLRRPRLHQVFHLPQQPGLSSLLSAHNSVAEAIHATPVDGLYLIPSGDLPHNPTELLRREHMRGLLRELSDRFDLLIVDTPPILAAAETSVLAAEANAVLVVVRAGQTDRRAAEHAVQQLAYVGAQVIGAVLNDPDAHVPRYGSYYYAPGYYTRNATT